MRRVVFLDHLDTCAAVFSDLINIGPFEQAHTNIGVMQAVRRSGFSITVCSEFFPIKNRASRPRCAFLKHPSKLKKYSRVFTVITVGGGIYGFGEWLGDGERAGEAGRVGEIEPYPCIS